MLVEKHFLALKNMKVLLVTILALWGASGISQENKIYVEYDHGQFLSTFSNKEVLIAGKDKARYDVQELKKIDNKTEYVGGLIKNIKVLDFDSIEPTTFFKFTNSNHIYYNDYVGGTEYFIKDTLPVQNWELIANETKEILGYICNKAKLKYRGSEFTAFYTSEIPTTFGPWKFTGLPGLILEITLDDDVTFNWKATKILYPYTEKVSFDFEKEKYKTSLRSFIKEKEKDRDEKQKIFDEKYADGAVITRTYKPVGPEKVYEW